MKNRIRFIILMMCFSIAGIISLQFLWIANSYKVNKTQLLRDINQSLEDAVQEEYNLRFKSFAQINTSDSTSIVISSAENKSDINLDSLMKELSSDDIDMGKDGYTLKIDASELNADSGILDMPENIDFQLKNIIKNLLASEVNQDNIIKTERLDSIFKSQLNSRGIYGSYNLQIEKDTASYEKLSNGIASIIMPISILKKNYARAVFDSKYQLVLNRMIGILIASLVLIILAVVSFMYMLRTILKQKKLSEVKNDFINNMTHELKTPIATVSTAIEAMLNFGALQDPEKSKNYLNISYKELQRLSGLIEKVLNVSRLERNKVELYKEKIDAIEIFNDITEKYKTGTVKEADFKINSSLKSFEIFADRTHFTNVISNLVDNAIKYSGERVNIALNLFERNGYKNISIKDTGWGISKENQKKIFDKFYRVPKGNIHNVKGFGLGLHYAYNIINQHGGTLEVKSSLGKGSEFIIKLPANE